MPHIKKISVLFLDRFFKRMIFFCYSRCNFFNASMFYSSQKCTLHSGWKSKKSLTYLYSLCTLQIFLLYTIKGLQKNVRYSCVFYWFFRGFSTLSTLYTLHWRLLMALWAWPADCFCYFTLLVLLCTRKLFDQQVTFIAQCTI